jgi:CRP-like cAMP-binding protein
MSVPAKSDEVKNRILFALPQEEYRLLTAQAEAVSLNVGDTLYESNEQILHVHFILNGLGSIVSTLGDGTTVEAAIVGSEGVVGLAALDAKRALVPTRAYVQIAGRSIRVPATAFREAFVRGGVLQQRVVRYLNYKMVLLTQTTACNRIHTVDQRLARWLLMVQDRVATNEVMLTHDLLAEMLGTGRPSVTLAVGAFQQSRLIECGRGKIRIVDRAGLQEAACECYPIVKESWDRWIEE